jgi:hypothetical protein
VVISPSDTQTLQDGDELLLAARANLGSQTNMSYEWHMSGTTVSGLTLSDQVVFSSSTDREFLFNRLHDLGAGTYQVYCVIRNCMGGTGVSTSKTTIIIKPNVSLLPVAPIATNPYFSGQKTCLDVRKTPGVAFEAKMPVPDAQNPWMGGQLPLNVRPDDFRNGFSFTWNFTGNGIILSSIDYILEDPSKIVESITGAGTNRMTLKFIDNIVQQATGRDKLKAYEVTVYAIFSIQNDPVPGAIYKEPIKITVQDGACGCPAQIKSGRWKMDYCFAAGEGAINNGNDKDMQGRYTGNPYVFSVATQGAFYKWGAKYPTATYTIRDLDSSNKYRAKWASEVQGAVPWPVDANPCPYGWRPMNNDEMTGLGNNTWNKMTNANTNASGSGGQLKGMVPITGGGYRGAAGQGSQVGLLPAEDARFHVWGNSTATDRSQNGWNVHFYNSNSVVGPQDEPRGYGLHVRCVQEGPDYGADGY